MPNPPRPRVPLSPARAARVLAEAEAFEREMRAGPDPLARDLSHLTRRLLQARIALKPPTAA